MAPRNIIVFFCARCLEFPCLYVRYTRYPVCIICVFCVAFSWWPSPPPLCSILNQHLQSLMPGLTAKVFRTYNASETLQRQLPQEEALANLSVAEKVTNRIPCSS